MNFRQPADLVLLHVVFALTEFIFLPFFKGFQLLEVRIDKFQNIFSALFGYLLKAKWSLYVLIDLFGTLKRFCVDIFASAKRSEIDRVMFMRGMARVAFVSGPYFD